MYMDIFIIISSWHIQQKFEVIASAVSNWHKLSTVYHINMASYNVELYNIC